MGRSLHSRFVFALALFAWLAQLCLPVAHASVMAQSEPGLAAWCGLESPGMKAQLARLEPEIRAILEQGSASADKFEHCIGYCASNIGGGPSAAPATVVLRAAGLEPDITPVTTPARRSHAANPPARGPPSLG